MKNVIVISLTFLVITCAKAQVITNYVRNPDFERYDTCPPDIFNTVSYSKYWSAIDSLNTFTKGYGFPEYCNACIPISGSTEFGVPYGRYFQYAHSGKGMMHGYFFCDAPPPFRSRI